MDIVIVVVLAVVWVVALTPLLLRKRSERQFAAEVGSYQRSLVRLGASSYSVQSFGRSRNAASGASIASSAVPEGAGIEPYGELTTHENSANSGLNHDASTAPGSVSPAMAARRRLVLSVLVGSTLFFLLVGFLLGARFLWAVAFVALACTCTYLGLLVYFHRVAVERAQKVIALETRRHASEVLESRRHVVALAHAGHGNGGYGSRYASTTRPMLGGTGWCVMGAHSHRSSDR